MADQDETEATEIGKNQNEQSSADEIEIDEDGYEHAVPAVIDLDEDAANAFDIDKIKALFARPEFRKKKAVSTTSTSTVTAESPESVDEPGDDDILADNDLEHQITALKTQVDLEKANTLRALADLQNLRRRSDDERTRIIREGNERLLKEILPIIDDFERGLNASRETQSYELLINGVESVLRKTADVLAKQGVQPIPAVGEQFNPDLHEAVQVIEGTEQPDESIVQELQKGYTLFGRVIRPSLVSVAKS